MRNFHPIVIFLFIVFFGQQLLAQKSSKITGRLVDSTQQPLIAATVVLLNSSDSSFAAYGLTTDVGTFQLEGKKDSSYLLQISYVGYASFSQQLTISKDTSFGTIILAQVANTLGLVEVKAEHIPMRMRGDTLEFNTAAFHTQTHDDVEKLLKQLPGFEIQTDGSITINGKVVTEILVDGKEFFGDNAQAVLKNLPADAIKKIEVLNAKKNKDGSVNKDDEKKIDLKLKEEAKTGWLGTLEGGYGYPDHRYYGSANLNYFNSKMRMSVFGGINNVNKQALAFERNVFTDNGSLPGFIRSAAGGMNASFFLKENVDLSFAYTYYNTNTIINSTNFRQSILPENYYTRNSSDSRNITSQQHQFFTNFLHKFDGSQKLRVRLQLNYNTTDNLQNKLQETLGTGDTLENKINQNYQQNGQEFKIAPYLTYEKDFKKKGRSLTINTSVQLEIDNNLSNNNSQTNLYNDTGQLERIDTLQQEQIGVQNKQTYKGTISYKEPIGKDNMLEIKLTAGANNAQKDRTAFDIDNQEKTVNNNLTGGFQKFFNYQDLEMNFERKVEKYILEIGAGFSRSSLQGTLSSNPNPILKNYYYPTGDFKFRYLISPSKKITFRYNTRFSEPQLEQLQPIVDNQDPLTLSIGNPNLVAEYNHGFSLRCDWYEQATFTNFYAAMYFNFTQNPIVQSQSLDENYRVLYQPINTGLSYRGGAYFGYNSELKKLGVKVIIRGGMYLNQQPIFMNGIAAKELNHNYNGELTVTNKKKEIFDISLTAKLNVGNSIFETNKALNVTYINHSYALDTRVTIAKKWNISASLDYNFYTNTSFGEAIAIPILAAKINRTFLKDDALKIEFAAENLINEPIKVVRSSSNGQVSESKSNLLGRYFMLSLTYKISRKNKL